MGPETFLIGHALSNDFKVLGIYHHKIIETAILTTSNAVFPDRKPTRTWALKDLTQTFIGEKIQAGQDGHSALEDARATRPVLLWCLEHQQRLRDWGVATRRQLEGLPPLTSNSADEDVQNDASTSVISSLPAHDSRFDDLKVRIDKEKESPGYASSTPHCQKGTDARTVQRGPASNNSTLNPEWTIDPDSVQTDTQTSHKNGW
ncbi:uncharacterized protein N7496_004663 [Penicillium cataractarum]|uniref:Exonuclease domain-containing protein n=1 Tax=Penicillium cataractarum TaxID=2100454 RepID=A0A9W9SHB4_9EURO|nr:uncharacterized protein N7496_004663 [Penicillium cataractarum]KAJ5377254.1 hypothetical protein N7496_004663 [Penicillium cataractarum]